MDGAALAARARVAAPSLPVLLCTGAPESSIGALRARFDGVLRKPIAAPDLVAAALRALARRREGDD